MKWTHPDKKHLVFLTDCIVALILITFVVCASLIGLNLFKPQIEAAASQALGMTVTIGGTIELDLLPHAALSVNKLRVHGREADPLSVKRMSLSIRLLPLLRRKFQVLECTLVEPRVTLRRDSAGALNFTGPAASGKERETRSASLPAVPSIDRLAVTGGRIVYADARMGRMVTIDNLDIDLHAATVDVSTGITAHDASFAGDMTFRTRSGSDDIVLNGLQITVRDIIVGLASASRTGAGTLSATTVSFATDVSMTSLRVGDFFVSPLTFAVTARNGMFIVRSLSFVIFGGTGAGGVSVDLRGAVPEVSLQAVLSGFRTEEFIASLRQKETTKGRMDLSLDLKTGGADRASMVRGLNGTFTLSSRDLTLHMIDLDALLMEIRKSQSFSLIDIGAYFFAGPLGTALTQGYDFAGVYRKAGGGTTSISNVISRWILEDGMAQAADVAIATARNRVAVKGTLDLLRREYKQVTVAVLDRKGCAILSQPINGPFGNPRLGAVSIVKSLVGPVLGILKKTRNIVLLDQCKPFYAGSLQHPDGGYKGNGSPPAEQGMDAAQ